MVEKVQGFMTKHGVFYEDEQTAVFEEAKKALVERVEQLGVRANGLLRLIDRCYPQMRGYLDAYGEQAQEDDSDESDKFGEPDVGGDDNEGEPLEDNIDTADDSGGEDDDEGVQLLPPGVRKPVPDVGRHIQPTKILHERKVNGPRGRQSNARGIRSSEGVATRSRGRAAEARSGDGEEDI
jgi:hypothetical protein